MQPARLLAACIAVTIYFFSSCSSGNNSSKTQLGEINFSASGKAEAQPYFQKGLLLLHSFEYVDAAEEFQKAKKTDPGFVMAYWGEAMTHNHSLWRYQDYNKAISVLNELAPTPEGRESKAKTEWEKDFIKGINILYGAGSKTERDSRYAAFMGELYKKYPGNNEVAAFYSIALIGSVPVGRNTKVYEQAAELAKNVLAKNPRHPGALHYLIHAYDDPDHASMALKTADAYSTVAPDAGHALHMPTHIYLALGIWDKVVSSNIVSWEASQKRKKRKGLTNDALNYHAYHWLLYGYLQQGNKEEAKKILNEMKLYSTELNSNNAREHMIYQKTTYLAETNDYGSDVNAIEVKQDDLNITTRAMNHFVNGMNAFYKKDAEALNTVITQLAGNRLLDEERIASTGNKLCGSINSSIPNKLDLQQAEVMELELKAMEVWLKKDAAAAEKLLKHAVDLEKNISYAYGPPPIVKPSFELYGEWLLATNKPKEALQQFEQSLKTAPGRILSIQGKDRATKLLEN
jgi:tetratricopeptide (TPR) repeat protein